MLHEILRSILRVCVAREFTKLADRTSPVVGWLRALAASAFRECGGPGVGVVGMCFTGGFALATALEPSVVASVMSQPAMPAPIGERGRAALGLDAEDLCTITERANDSLRVLGLRFTNDRGCLPQLTSPGRRRLRGSGGPMMFVARVVTGILLLAHGLVHLLYLAPDVPEFSLGKSWLVPDTAHRPLGLGLMTATVATFLLLALAVWGVPGLSAVWVAITVVAALLSTVLLVAFWDIHLVFGFALDVAIFAVAAARPYWAEQLIGTGG